MSIPQPHTGAPKRLYGYIEKVEEVGDGTIKVHGIASTESEDDQGEIVRAAAMREAIPDYMQFGAVREMHGLSAAGRALECNCDDDGVTRMVAHVVDPTAVLKVKNRVYNGFSIGGRVLEREAGNSRSITRLALHEISLVDRPANPQATIDLWKLGDNLMPEGLGAMEAAFAEALAKVGPQIWPCADPSHRHARKEEAAKCIVAKAAAPIVGDPQTAAKTGLPDTPPIKPGEPPGAPNSESNFDGDDDDDDRRESAESAGGGFSPESDANRHADFGESGANVGKKGDGKKGDYGDVSYADPGYRGKPRYPIDKEDHVRAAWSYINMPKNAKKYSSSQLASIKSKIRAAAKKHGIEIAAKVADAGDESEITNMARELTRFVEMLGDLTIEKAGRRQSAADHFLMNVAHDAIGKLGDAQWCAKAGGNATQDTGRNATHPAPSASPPAETYTPGQNATQDTSKRGSRHSAATMSHLKAAHDAMCKAGAMCGSDMHKAASTTEDSAMSAADSLFTTTLSGEPDEVAKALKKALKKNDKMEKQMGDMAHQMQTMKLHVEHMAKHSGNPNPPPPPAPPAEKEGKLKKQLSAMGEQMDAMKATLELIAKQPVPGNAIHLPPGIIDVTKAQDGRQEAPPAQQTQAAEELAKRWESMTPDERFAASYAVSRMRPYTQQQR
jgi:hypothetical protein